MDLVFNKVSYHPSEEITGLSPGEGTILVTRLGVMVAKYTCTDTFNLGTFPEGAYAITWNGSSGEIMTSAFEVLRDPWSRIRYGFVSEYSDSVVVDNYISWAKTLHLTSIQFYDWAWRHEILTTDELHYRDSLGNDISTEKIKELINEYTQIGSIPSGYVAVYAVDSQGWQRWQKAGLFDVNGNPYQLGEDFLWILDPADSYWLPHLVSQLQNAHKFGFSAFHLDQYGWPKHALRADGTLVDLAVQFPKMLNEIVKVLPECRHIFNNVNDFPTWSTTQADQDATYIEVWEPHTTYDHLANLVCKARNYNPARPIILSAYLRPFKDAEEEVNCAEAITSFELTYSSIVSGGASHLITGGDGRVLHDPYYVNNHQASESSKQVMRNYYDFTVAAGDLLYDSSRVDVTLTHAFGINNEIKLISNVPISPEATAGHLWIRIFTGQTGLTIHAINLLDQEDSFWDKPKVVISAEVRLKISIQAEGFLDQASVGHACDGAVFALKAMEVDENRIQLEVDVHGAWTIANIPYRSK